MTTTVGDREDQGRAEEATAAKNFLEIEKIKEDIRSARQGRMVAIISAVASIVNIALIGISAATIYMLVQRPSVDIARIDSERRAKLDLLRMEIDLRKTRDVENKDTLLGQIRLYMSEIVSKEALAIVDHIRSKEKTHPIKVAQSPDARGKCTLQDNMDDFIEDFREINRRLGEARLMLANEEKAAPIGPAAGRGPVWQSLQQTVRLLEQKRQELFDSVPPECRAELFSTQELD